MIWLAAVIFLYAFPLGSKNRIALHLSLNEEKIDFSVKIYALDGWIRKKYFLIFTWSDKTLRTNFAPHSAKRKKFKGAGQLFKAVTQESMNIAWRLDAKLGLENAAATALLAMFVFETFKDLAQLSLCFTARQNQQIHVEPSFSKEEIQVQLHCMVSFTTAHIIYALVKNAPKYLRRKEA